METKINNWIEQANFFGLDYATAKATVGAYEFDIIYDCDGIYDKGSKSIRDDIKPNNCGLTLIIRYKNRVMYSGFGDTVDELKNFAEKWLRSEVLNYYRKYCVMFSEAELRGTSN